MVAPLVSIKDVNEPLVPTVIPPTRLVATPSKIDVVLSATSCACTGGNAKTKTDAITHPKKEARWFILRLSPEGNYIAPARVFSIKKANNNLPDAQHLKAVLILLQKFWAS